MIKDIPGLTGNEAKIYLTLLNLKEAGATKISEKAGLFRTLCYDILTKLVEKGLVSYVKIEGKRIYKPGSPTRLLELIKEKENETNLLIPELNSLFQMPQEEISVEQYEGINGMKAVTEDMFNYGLTGKTKQFYFLGATGESMKFFDVYLARIIKQVKEAKLLQKIDFRGIWSSNLKTDRIIKMIGKPENHRFLPEGFASTTPVFIYGDKVVINGGISKQFVVVIKNKETADSFRYYFEFMWKTAKK